MAEMGKYIYGIINSNSAFQLFVPKDFLESKRSGTAREVYTISHQDISAIVNDSEIVDYTHLFKDALAGLLVGHQKVIERIMDLGYSVIPMKLGTFAMDESEVKDILNKGYNLIKEIIQKIENKIEIDVVAIWSNLISELKDIGEEKEIKELKKELLAGPKGITVEDQMKVGIIVKRALEERRESYAFQIQNILKAVSDDFKQHELMDDKMVINSAFLIDKAKQNEFYAKIEELNKEFKEKLNFRCVGPLPPYSFYTLEIKKMQYEEIDWARRQLGLSDVVTKGEIKKAHQAKAISFHPDRNPDTPGIEKEFGEVNRAYKMLAEYCLACEQAGQLNSVSFSEDEFKKNTILIKLKE